MNKFVIYIEARKNSVKSLQKWAFCWSGHGFLKVHIQFFLFVRLPLLRMSSYYSFNNVIGGIKYLTWAIKHVILNNFLFVSLAFSCLGRFVAGFLVLFLLEVLFLEKRSVYVLLEIWIREWRWGEYGMFITCYLSVSNCS